MEKRMKSPEELIGLTSVQTLLDAGYQIVRIDTSTSYEVPFEKMWDHYPHKVAKVAARRAYVAARRAGIEHEIIAKGLWRYIQTKPADRPWMMLSTFINGKRWNDMPAPVYSGGAAGVRQRLTQDIENEQVRAGRESESAVDDRRVSLFDQRHH